MDPASFIGLGAALAAIYFLIFSEGGDPTHILLPGPLVLVFGGTLGVGIMGSMMSDMKLITAAVKKAFLSNVDKPTAVIEEIVALAGKARREGLLALEEELTNVDNEFLKDGLQSAIDGTDPEELKGILYDKVDAKQAEDKVSAKFFTDMGGFAPTVGIVGTVISLVHVLGNLSDPGELGHMISAAFVATLWGVFAANILFLPIANRLKRMTELELAAMNLIIEGIVAIQAGSNPRLVQQKLSSLLPPADAAAAAADSDKKAA